MKTCILGFGTMGEMYARLIVRNGGNGCDLWIANRTFAKMVSFKKEYGTATITDDIRSATKNADIVFLCVSPGACHEVLKAIRDSIPTKAMLVSFASDVSIANIETFFSGKILRVVPTITSYVGRGITLVSMNDRANDSDLALVQSLIGDNIRFTILDDDEINDYSILSSCGPGIVSSILEEMQHSFERTGTLNEARVADILQETVTATCAYAASAGKSFAEILSEVATKGGITETGTAVVKDQAGKTFDEMIQRMQAKHVQRSAHIDGQFE